MKKCIMCGKEFIVSKYNKDQKYCCKQCGRKHYHIVNREKSNKQSNDWYKNNRQDKLVKMARYRSENKDLFDWYKNKERFDGQRLKVLERDNYMCQTCGVPGGKELNVHHKDKNRKNNQLSNLITLCHSCHSRLHRMLEK